MAAILAATSSPRTLIENRRDRRLVRNQNGKRKVVVVVRERGGNSVPAVFKSEAKAMAFLRAHVAKGTIMNADEAGSWEELHKRYEVKRINHQEAYSLDGACTNWAEEFFSRMRRAEIGHHHHIAGAYLLRYAQEASWREDNRRVSNGEQVSRVAGLAMAQKQSVDFSGILAASCFCVTSFCRNTSIVAKAIATPSFPELAAFVGYQFKDRNQTIDY